MVILYTNTCETCSGNRAASEVKRLCGIKGVGFEQRLTPLWRRFKEEADAISKASGLKEPFMYGTESKTAISATTFTNGEQIEKLVDLEAQGAADKAKASKAKASKETASEEKSE